MSINREYKQSLIKAVYGENVEYTVADDVLAKDAAGFIKCLRAENKQYLEWLKEMNKWVKGILDYLNGIKYPQSIEEMRKISTKVSALIK